MNNVIINVKDLIKIYSSRERDTTQSFLHSLFKRKLINKYAINNLSMEINKGEFVGIIGPNGAGKTTLAKILTGIIHPTSGYIEVMDYIPYKLKNEFKKRIAFVMGQKTQLWWDLSVIDALLLNKDLYEIPKNKFSINLDFLTDLMDVKELLNIQVRRLSLGERMKMELIASLIHDPELLFLDEPTIGLDFIAQRKIRKHLKQINKIKGTTILLTSHYMEDIEELCERVLIINNGKKAYDGKIHSLNENYSNLKYIAINYEDKLNISCLQKDGISIVDSNQQTITISLSKDSISETIKDIISNNRIRDIKVYDEPIENIIKNIYGSEG
ncbi:MAG: ATP-binding cassette domain-containing protein [Bacteroidales bacterium]|jgi:ABC-2 type transport system ATP-binding protein|nr:ATP-binding cassette domain-containing protein [Bacteroidales bacterium]